LDKLELYYSTYSYYRLDQCIDVNDSPTIIKLLFNLMNPEARVNTHNIKD